RPDAASGVAVSRAAVRPTSVRCVRSGSQPGCRQTDVGTLCPFQAAITALGQRIDRSSAPAVAMVLP
ncbi:hypothetical protein C7D72_26490, partial [Klebsiella pneumoniae]